jgi:stage II sporulation protein D
MLKPGYIPQKEPKIRVGIILPEDSFHSISLRTPAESSVVVDNGEESFKVDRNYELNFKISGSNIYCSKKGESPVWTVSVTEQKKISPFSGIHVKDVIAGRGFHWQKYIDVYLPSTVEIKNHQGVLILINELPLEQYLMCVATSEMGAQCPAALIEAQTIVARSWMLANVEQKHIALGMDVCNDDCCQRYQGTGNLSLQSIRGADRTRGLVLMYDNKICDARYSKSCGGVMETFSTIWGGTDAAYLQGIPDAPAGFSHPALPLSDENRVKEWVNDKPNCFCSSLTVKEENLGSYLGSVDESSTYFRWKKSYIQEELTALLNDTLDLNALFISNIRAEGRGSSGRMIICCIDYKDKNGKNNIFKIERDVNIRAALHKKFLYSSCFYTHTEGKKERPDRFILHGAGWGHGVGLCQIGALGMGLKGYTSTEITKHYYPGSELKKIYD